MRTTTYYDTLLVICGQPDLIAQSVADVMPSARYEGHGQERLTAMRQWAVENNATVGLIVTNEDNNFGLAFIGDRNIIGRVATLVGALTVDKLPSGRSWRFRLLDYDG